MSSNAAFTHNPDPSRGMLTSVQNGIKFLPEDCEAFFIHPVDIPLVQIMTIRNMLAALSNSFACAIPVHSGRKGHPVLLNSVLREQILKSSHPDGLRGILKDIAGGTCKVQTADSLCLLDMDTREEYIHLCKLAPFTDYLFPEEAVELLEFSNVPRKGIAHGLAVGSIAVTFVECMTGCECHRCQNGLSASLAKTGGILHDICKGVPNHEAAAGRLLRDLGLSKLAPLVEDHLDIDLPPSDPIAERDLVFLADKYVYGHNPVKLEERFAQKLRIFARDSE